MSSAALSDLLTATQSPYQIAGPKTDRYLWDTAAADAPAIHTLLQTHPDWPTFPALLQDVFQTFYQIHPTLRPEADVAPAMQSNRPYVETLLHAPATAVTRVTTERDPLTAAMATLITGQRLAEEIAQQPALQTAMAQATPPPPQIQGQLDRAIRHAVTAAETETSDLQQQCIQWGLDGGALTTMPLGERLTFAQTLLQPRFRRMADLIGRLRRLARSRQGGALRHLRDEWYRITQGDDLSRVLPSEWVFCSDPTLRLEFSRRWLEQQLAQYDVRPIPREGRGPILCAIDCSSSMASDGRMDWAMAVALALLDTARRQRRDFGAVFFNTTCVAEFLLPHGQIDPPTLLAFAQVGPSGGTDFAPPLQWACDQIAQARFHHADLTLITDGECRLSPTMHTQLAAQQRASGFRIFGLLIGGTAEGLAPFTDHLWHLEGGVHTADADAAVGTLFAELVPH
jgi:hypothetical protein